MYDLLRYIFLIAGCFHLIYAQSIPKMPLIEANLTSTPPEWAVMQRSLITSMEKAGDYYWERFTRRGGTTLGDGPYDDLYEMFYNWPEFYSIGGDERFFNRALTAHHAITRSNTPYPPDPGNYFNRLYKEFPKHDDFFHISEGMTLFYNLGLGDPRIPENIERARRFAGFYLNEDPEAPNFDPENGIVKSIFTGSQGPLATSDAEYNLRYGHASLFPVIEDLESNWNAFEDRKQEIQHIYDSVVTRTDVPVNLGITGMMTHAYLYTGEDKYRDWVLRYVENWISYIEKNDGILPDNIGQTGQIGEYRNGQWWGGLYGWYGRYGVMMMYAAMSVASENALLLSGDTQYLKLIRSQLNMLYDQAITTPSGQELVPYRYHQDGWRSYRPMMIRDWVHLWHASQDSADWRKIAQIHQGHKYRPLNGEGIWGQNTLDHLDTLTYKQGAHFDWAKEMVQGDRTTGKSEYARWMYYAGYNPRWPVEALQADYQEVINRMEFMRNDPRPVSSILGDDTYPNNPVLTKVLTQMIQGSPQTIYFGGLSRALLRYYDAEALRPGLPDQVAALVTQIYPQGADVELVNISPVDTQSVIVQAGAFAENRFTSCTYKVNEVLQEGESRLSVKTVDINGSYLEVVLPPSAILELHLEYQQFVNNPSYAFPWHEKKYLFEE